MNSEPITAPETAPADVKTARTNAATGPRTPEGKAIASRNAVTHGLFARQTVLTHLGEDPALYAGMLNTLVEQLRPRNLMERQYIELWLDCSWRLARLSRLEARVWEDDALGDDATLTKLERLARLQNSLRRQMDKSVKLLGQDIHQLFRHRTREDILERMDLTEAQLAKNPYRRNEVERTIQANSHWPMPVVEPEAPSSPAVIDVESACCPERVVDADLPALPAGDADGKCENELPDAPAPPSRIEVRPRLSATLPPVVVDPAVEYLQKVENALNDQSVPIDERLSFARGSVGLDRVIRTPEDGFRVRR